MGRQIGKMVIRRGARRVVRSEDGSGRNERVGRLLSGRNRSIVARRAGTTGKLLIKMRERGFKNQKWYVHTIQYQGGSAKKKVFSMISDDLV